MSKSNSNQLAKLAFRFVLIIGIVNLFADMAYEGGRSITGPFLGSLGGQRYCWLKNNFARYSGVRKALLKAKPTEFSRMCH